MSGRLVGTDWGRGKREEGRGGMRGEGRGTCVNCSRGRPAILTEPTLSSSVIGESNQDRSPAPLDPDPPSSRFPLPPSLYAPSVIHHDIRSAPLGPHAHLARPRGAVRTTTAATHTRRSGRPGRPAR